MEHLSGWPVGAECHSQGVLCIEAGRRFARCAAHAEGVCDGAPFGRPGAHQFVHAVLSRHGGSGWMGDGSCRSAGTEAVAELVLLERIPDVVVDARDLDPAGDTIRPQTAPDTARKRAG